MGEPLQGAVGREQPDRPGSPSGVAVAIEGLSVGYADRVGHRPVLDGVDATLEPGRCLAVVGPSGCGKSTLLHVLAGLLPPASGRVTVDGATVASPGRATTGHAAYLFQSDLLLPWASALSNATLAARLAHDHRLTKPETEARARALLEEFGLGDRLDAHPHELSGGMRQRVALARTLLLDRGLMLLDEPFGSLDTLTRRELQQWLLDVMVQHPATWVLVTHDVPEAVLLGDRVIVLSGSPARVAGSVEIPLPPERRRAAAHDDLAAGLLRRLGDDVYRLLEDGRRA